MYLISSFDGGRTFGPARKLGTTSWPLAACPMDGGAVTADLAGRPLTVWRRELTIVATGPDQLERTIGEGTQPWIASGPDGAHVVWMGGTAAHREPRPLLWRSPTAVKPVTLADAVVAPVVAAGPRGPVVAAWEVPGPTSAIRAAVLAP
jgi:hypothetical protein